MRGIRLAKFGMHQRTGSGSMRTSLALVTVIAAGMLIGTATASAQGSRPLVVDDDSAQCPGAGYTTIQSAIDAAGKGDTVRVCGGVYHENVTIETSVKLVAKVPAAPAIDCLETTDTALPGNLAVITGGLDIAANDVEIDGVAISSPAMVRRRRSESSLTRRTPDTSFVETLSRTAGEFGIELQSSGAKQTIVERNCLRRNGTEIGSRAGLAAEFGALRNAVIRKNVIADNFEGISVAGPHPHAEHLHHQQHSSPRERWNFLLRVSLGGGQQQRHRCERSKSGVCCRDDRGRQPRPCRRRQFHRRGHCRQSASIDGRMTRTPTPTSEL